MTITIQGLIIMVMEIQTNVVIVRDTIPIIQNMIVILTQGRIIKEVEEDQEVEDHIIIEEEHQMLDIRLSYNFLHEIEY